MKKNWTILSELCGDAFCDRADKRSVLAAAVDFLSKGTKYRKDAIEIIKGCCPYYLEKDDSQNFDMLYKSDNTEKLQPKKYNKIFTACYSEEEANEVGHFIMSKGYEGVQNDSYRYCDMEIHLAFRENREHHKDHIYVGVNGCQMVVAKTKRGLRRRGLMFIEKKRKFFELLSRY